MTRFFPEAPQALAVPFSHSGQTWAWTTGLLLVSPGKWLGKWEDALLGMALSWQFLGGLFQHF